MSQTTTSARPADTAVSPPPVPVGVRLPGHQSHEPPAPGQLLSARPLVLTVEPGVLRRSRRTPGRTCLSADQRQVSTGALHGILSRKRAPNGRRAASRILPRLAQLPPACCDQEDRLPTDVPWGVHGRTRTVDVEREPPLVSAALAYVHSPALASVCCYSRSRLHATCTSLHRWALGLNDLLRNNPDWPPACLQCATGERDRLLGERLDRGTNAANF